MRFAILAFAAVVSPALVTASRPEPRVVRMTDTVYVKQTIDYDELSRRVAVRLAAEQRPTVIGGDLIVRGRLGVGGAPEPDTPYGITIRGNDDASIRFISNEALRDPQRAASQHRHVGSLSLGQDGGLRLDQNSPCYTNDRGCLVDDRLRRRAYSGFDSMGDMSFYLSDVESATGKETAPRAQSLVLKLLDWDGNIHLTAHRPGQRIYFNSSTTIHAADLQWEVPLK